MRETTDDPVSALIFEVSSKVETARAKINLSLHVTGRRADGYHLLDSLVVFAEVADTLRAMPRDDNLVTLDLDGPFAADLTSDPAPDDNLVLRAADLLLQCFPARRLPGVAFDLVKRLPVAAGLGGGSADAAAALRLLNRAWNLGLSLGDLAGIGLRLGADVPLCLHSRPLRAGGVGERIVPVAGMPSLPILLLNPGVPAPTRSVFRRLPPGERPGLPEIPAAFRSPLDLAMWLRKTRNDLAEPAAAEAPVIGTAAKVLGTDPDCLFARMSGSGGTIFGVFMSTEAAERAADRIHARRPDWWVAVTRTLGS